MTRARQDAPPSRLDPAPIRAFLDLVHPDPEDLIELRCLAVPVRGRFRETRSGYYFDRDALAGDAVLLNGQGANVYITANTIDPRLHARAPERLRVLAKGDPTTAAGDVQRRRLLHVDLDPRRPSGIASSGEEHQAALELAEYIEQALGADGWPSPIRMDTGNGALLLFGIDLPPDDPRPQRLLKALADRFDTAAVKVDTSVASASQLLRVAGTVNRKGAPTAERPHRLARVLNAPSMLAVVPLALIEKLGSVAAAPTRFRSRTSGTFEIEDFLHCHTGVLEPSEPRSANGGGRVWALGLSPLCPHGGDGPFVMQLASGAISAGCHHNSCSWGWRELRGRLDPASARPAPGPEDSEEWPEPEPLPSPLLPVASLDTALLPTGVRAYVEDCAERMQCPVDYLAMGMLVCLGAVIGRGATVFPKSLDEDWVVVPNLWGAIIGPPSIMKSPALRSSVSFVRALDRQENTAFQERKLEYRAEERLAKLEVREAERAATAALKGEDRERALELLHDAESKELEKPRCRRIECNDATVEAAGELLAASPAGILTFRDELLGFISSFDKDGWEAARAFYLEAWNGLGSFSYDRIGRGHVHIPSTTVSILGGIQPGPFRSHVARCLRVEEGADGMLQRFQLLVWPDIPASFRIVDRAVDSIARDQVTTVFERLAEFRRRWQDALDEGEDAHEPVAHHFDAEAQDLFFSWWDQHEKRLRAGEDTEHFVSHLIKYRKLVPALALIDHLAGDGELGTAIRVSSVERAIDLARYLETHARRAYGAGARPGAEAARLILKKISQGALPESFTAREVYRHQWSGLGKEQVEAAIETLVDFGWGRVHEHKPAGGGRPTTLFTINPRAGNLDPDARNKDEMDHLEATANSDETPAPDVEPPSPPTGKTDETPLDGVLSVLSVRSPGAPEDSGPQPDDDQGLEL